MSSEEADRAPSEGPTFPAGRVLLVGLVGLALAALLNADSLVAQAERKPFGWSRDFSLAVWEPVQDLSHLLQLHRPRQWVDELTGRADARSEEFVAPVTVQPPALSDADAAADDGSSAAGGSSVGDLQADPATTSEITGAEEEAEGEAHQTEVPLRTPTAADPLRVWIGGDSMSQVFGQSLAGFVGETGVMAGTLDYRISTGLSRPDYFNWPAHMAAELERLQPEVVVIMFGANDAQGLVDRTGAVHQEALTEGWLTEYRLRVGEMMDLLYAQGRVVYWVGQPIMRSSSFSERMAGLNGVYQEQAATRPWIQYVDTYSMFANSDGAYEAFLVGIDGQVHDMRQGDGIHLSRPGGDLLARNILDRIEAEAGLG